MGYLGLLLSIYLLISLCRRELSSSTLHGSVVDDTMQTPTCVSLSSFVCSLICSLVFAVMIREIDEVGLHDTRTIEFRASTHYMCN